MREMKRRVRASTRLPFFLPSLYLQPSPYLLTESAADVVLRGLFLRPDEDLLGGPALDEPPLQKEGGPVGAARGLHDVVGHEDDRDDLLEFLERLLDLRRRQRIEPR